jgi:uncharacterized caspase-like protein
MAKGRRLLFVDTCHSGGAYNQRLGRCCRGRWRRPTPPITPTSSPTRRRASTRRRSRTRGSAHGLFTYAVVEGLEGKGDLAARRQLSTKDLADYIRNRVGALAKAVNAAQEPQYFKGRDAEDFLLARW